MPKTLSDVKLENIMISGFESDEKKQDIDKIVVKLADCGSSTRSFSSTYLE